MRLEARGIGASPGIAVSTLHLVPRPGRARHRRVRDRAKEAERLRGAIDASRAEIEDARDGLTEEMALVLDAQLLMHSDALLVEAAVQHIVTDGLGAEWALERTVAALKKPLLAASSRYFRERAHDIEHVGQHILRHLRGDERLMLPDGARVLVANDLAATDAVRVLGDARVLGLVTELGSATSHTALLARAFGVPAVVGVQGLAMRALAPGTPIVVDGLSGRVVVCPTAAESTDATERSTRYRSFASALRAKADEPVQTVDGAAVTLLANIELPAEASSASVRGAAGVGLYRTEYLYVERDEPPDEETQVAVYREVIEACAPVTLRTFDLGGDKLPRQLRFPPGANPALGVRATRLWAREPELMETQIRAVLRAASAGEVELMFPLVEGPEHMRTLRDRVRACAEALRADGTEVPEIPLGAMVELPSAAVMATALCEVADFLSVGTNDLVQYTLGVDRTNPEVAHLADPLHPAVLHLLSQTVEAADASGTPLTMCGDMATDLVALPVALGLGFRCFSVPVSMLPFVQELIRRVDLAALTALGGQALRETSTAAVRALVREALEGTLGGLWVELQA